MIRRDKQCIECGKWEVVAKQLCNTCYTRDHKKNGSVTADRSTLDMIDILPVGSAKKLNEVWPE